MNRRYQGGPSIDFMRAPLLKPRRRPVVTWPARILLVGAPAAIFALAALAW